MKSIDIAIPPVAPHPWGITCYVLLRTDSFDPHVYMADTDLNRLRRHAYEKLHAVDFGQRFLTAPIDTEFRFNGNRFIYRACDYRLYLYTKMFRDAGLRTMSIRYIPDGDRLKYAYAPILQ